ncbi:BlaB/IND/MUS family subclass B1 metallo-beta-lactamase [Marivirga sp. S37H4]|uniref:beta-lactamase n=1 Tax=Marivirga aurantiaca TaxID=2802615 RepID=A0A934WXQ6_9BACT|nr:BlaB/IND/MUS family subclass B1 metallo-beta-lactamase [Marivirga aurantiaca]MBK6264842.1 BlaB/IND/MUS family subclass B1 metallo-beta-lactamase [Marivirga aurantiaca]
MDKIIFSLIILFFYNNAFSQTESTKLEITHLTGDFYVYTTFKDYKGTPFPSNGLYLITNEGAVIIDSPWDTSQFQPLLDSIKTRHNKNVVMYIATHSHDDRTAGLAYYQKQGIKTFTTEQTDKIIRERGEERAEFLILHDTIFTVGQYEIQTYYPGEGHTADNIIIWFEKDRVLYGGCLVKSVEAEDLGYIGEANIQEWPATIKNIKRKFSPDYVIPGHQDWNSNKALNHTLMLLKDFKK